MADETIFDLLQFDPDGANAGQGEITRGAAYLRLEKYTEAFEVFDALSKAHPELVSAWAGRAISLSKNLSPVSFLWEGDLNKLRESVCDSFSCAMRLAEGEEKQKLQAAFALWEESCAEFTVRQLMDIFSPMYSLFILGILGTIKRDPDADRRKCETLFHTVAELAQRGSLNALLNNGDVTKQKAREYSDLALARGLTKVLVDLLNSAADFIERNRYAYPDLDLGDCIRNMFDTIPEYSPCGENEALAKQVFSFCNCLRVTVGDAITLFPEDMHESIRQHDEDVMECRGELKRRIEEEAAARENARREAQEKVRKKSRKKKIVVFLMLLLIAGGIAGYYFIYVPEQAYSRATELFNNGEYYEAEKAFAALGDFRDSKRKLALARERQVSVAVVGDTFFFGSYEQDGDDSNGREQIEWRILDQKDGSVLAISRYILDYRAFSYDEEGMPTWEDCPLRTWLQNDFVREAFSATEQKKLLKNEIYTAPNDNGYGESNTTDSVWLLSVGEVERYFGFGESAKAYGTVSANRKVDAEYQDRWWLRNLGTGEDANDPAHMNAKGNAYTDADSPLYPYGVRPVIEIKVP